MVNGVPISSAGTLTEPVTPEPDATDSVALVQTVHIDGIPDRSQPSRYNVQAAPKKIRALLARFEADPDPLAMFSELAMLRALLVCLLEEWDATNEKGKKRNLNSTIHNASELIDAISRLVERIAAVRDGGKITEADLARLINQMGRVVDQAVPAGVINANVTVEADLLTGEAIKLRIHSAWMDVVTR